MVHDCFDFDAIENKTIAAHMCAKVLHLNDPIVFCKMNVGLKIDEIQQVKL